MNRVGKALELDEAPAEQEGDFDADSRWAFACGLGTKAETARERCYRPEIMRLARDGGAAVMEQGALFDRTEE